MWHNRIQEKKMNIGVWVALRRRTRIMIISLILLFYFMMVCCGESFLFKWDEVVVIGQPNYTYSAYNTGLKNSYSLALDPLDSSLWVGALGSNSSLFTFSTNFSANSSSFVLQPSKSIFIFNNAIDQSLLWLDSQTCLTGTSSGLFVTRDHFTTIKQLPVDYNGFNDYNYGLGYSKVSEQVFVSKYRENQIRVLANDGFFNKTLYVIGNPFNNNTLVAPPTASSLNNPSRIHQDCAGGLWVVDSGNCRALHFGWNQTVADAVIGQPNFNTNCSSNVGIFSQNKPPFGIAMNSDCSIMWISDLYRILRFRAPFNNTSQPEGVLGQPDFYSYSYYPASASTFSLIYDILYEYKTQRIYIVDYGNYRVVTGVTDEGSSRLVTIDSGETLQINSSVKDQTIVIAASLELKNGSLTRLKEGQLVLVVQNISFGGVLSLTINSTTQDGQRINVFNFSSSDNSSFSQIVVLQNDGGRSGCLTGTGQYEPKNMAVLIQVNPSCRETSQASINNSSQQPGDGENTQARTIIIAVVVGVGGIFILCVIIVGCVVLGVIKWAQRKQIQIAMKINHEGRL